jgi:hypothetical protein
MGDGDDGEGEDEEAEGAVIGTVNRLLLLYHRL